MYVASTAPSSPVHRRRPVEGPRPGMHAEVRARTVHDRPRTESRTRTMAEAGTRTRTKTRTGTGTETRAWTTNARTTGTRPHARATVGPRERSPRKRGANNARNHQFFGHFIHFYLLFLLFPLGTVPSLHKDRHNQTGKLTIYLQKILRWRYSTSRKCVAPTVPSESACRNAANGAFLAVGSKSMAGA